MARTSHTVLAEPGPQASGAKVYALRLGDEELVAGLKAHRPQAQAELVRRFQGRVGAVLHRVLGEDDELADLTQEVFLRAFSAAPRFRGDADVLEGWLVRIAVFTARGTIRRRRVWRRFFVWSEGAEELAPASPGAAPDDVDAVRRVYAVLDKLPSQERIPFALQLIDGMPLGEVATACEQSLSTVKRRLRRARQRFEALAARDPVLREWLNDAATGTAPSASGGGR